MLAQNAVAAAVKAAVGECVYVCVCVCGERCWIRGRSKVKGGGEGAAGRRRVAARPVLEKEGWRR